ncbi:MAG: hypothetical protein ABI193_13570 [Minicystis sp.]
MKHASIALLSLASLALAACFSPVAPGPRLSESANDLNNATRFGRMDIALEHVGPKEREIWAKAHASWGRNVRIVDLEMAGMNLKKSSEAEVMVNVSWQKPDQSNVLITAVLQNWKDVSGTWFLMSEEEKAGDTGLLADDKKPANEAATATVSPNAPRFQTRVIYSSDE